MTAFLQLALELAILLALAKTSAYISIRLRQPAVLGELLIGILVGPSLVDVTHLPFITSGHLDEVITELGEIGVLLLMFLAGLELHISDLARNTRVSAYAGVLGVLFPLGMGWGFGRLIGLGGDQALFLGLTMGATSVSISAQTLIELKALRSRVGFGLLGAAVFDDVLVILFMSSFLAIISGGGSGTLQILITLGRMLLFLILSLAFGLWVLPRLVRAVAQTSVSQGAVTFAIVIMLVYGVAAELLGEVAAITGTFIAGLMFARTPEKTLIEPGLRAIAYGFFVPIFFVSIGLGIDLHDIQPAILWTVLGVIVLAALGKVLGAGLGAKLSGFSGREALQLGIGMISRGEVGLILASVGLSNGLLTPAIYSAIIGMVLVTTLITPPLLRAAFRRAKKPQMQPVVQPSPEVDI
ncbi:MAG: cation:proton antiporter [Anaerolineae bacterium]|nr:cation:proton antiporter [Anaerolineae bacterium]